MIGRDRSLSRTVASLAKYVLILLSTVLFVCREIPAESRVIHYHGMCDASAAVMVGNNKFIAADDEDNILRVYDLEKGGAPLELFDIANYFSNNPKKREVDIEGAAWFNKKILWITSHSNNSQGESRRERHQIFFTEVTNDSNGISMKLSGSPYQDLIQDLKSSDLLSKYHFEAAEKLAPEEKGGLNIEGITTMPGDKLLIGFRSPIINGKALLIIIKNPGDLLNGKRPVIESVVELDLGDRGIRSIEYSETLQSYFIVAGPTNDDGDFHIYQWSGLAAVQPKIMEIPELKALSPEALILVSGKMIILSDDGGMETTEKTLCKHSDVSQKSFRGITLPLKTTDKQQ